MSLNPTISVKALKETQSSNPVLIHHPFSIHHQTRDRRGVGRFTRTPAPFIEL